MKFLKKLIHRLLAALRLVDVIRDTSTHDFSIKQFMSDLDGTVKQLEEFARQSRQAAEVKDDTVQQLHALIERHIRDAEAAEHAVSRLAKLVLARKE